MNSTDTVFATVMIALFICISIVGSIAIVLHFQTNQCALQNGYIEVQNIGSTGYRWVKP